MTFPKIGSWDIQHFHEFSNRTHQQISSSNGLQNEGTFAFTGTCSREPAIERAVRSAQESSMGSVRGFRVECQVREAGGFFGGHTYAAARVTLERGRDEIKYLQCTKLSPGDGEGTCTSGETQQGSVRLPLAGMKLKVQKGLVACCSYSKTKDEARTATHFKFESEDVLRSFLGEMASFPEIFRRFRDYYEVGEKVGEGHTCVVYKAKSKIDGGVYAIKLSTKSKESHKEMHNELRILRYLRNEHPALPRVNDYFYDSKVSIVYPPRSQIFVST